MTDSYQPIYDATRSRIGSCDAERAIRDACSLDGSFAIDRVRIAFEEAAYNLATPSAIYRPRIAIDGSKWCALYGDNMREGVAGFGDSPAQAMADFDRNWNAKLEPANGR